MEMSKTWFMVFCIYSLVIVFFLLGYFSENTLYYQLGTLNAGVILVGSLIAIFTAKQRKKRTKTKDETAIETATNTSEHSSHDDSSLSEEKEEKEEKSDSLKQSSSSEHTEEKGKNYAETMLKTSLTTPHSKSTKKKSYKKPRYGQWLLFILSLALAVALWYIGVEFLEVRTSFLALIIGFLVFAILGKTFEVRGFYQLKSLITTWLYYLLILGSLLYTGTKYFQNEEAFKKIDHYLHLTTAVAWIDHFNFNQLTHIQNRDFHHGFSFVGSHQISSVSPFHSSLSTRVEQYLSSSSDLVEHTPSLDPDKTYTMFEAIKSLMDTNQIPLSQKTNTTFKSPLTQEEYPYIETAYEKKLIGKDSNVHTPLTCDTYMVMKGLIQGWNVGTYTSSTIKSVYRNYAQQHQLLNGCKKGSFVTQTTL